MLPRSIRDTLSAVRVVAVLILAGVIAASCSRVGDDRFPKLPDAAPPDAVDFTPDAAGPVDALDPADAAVDAAPPPVPDAP
jgi:hypothetical protein